MNWRFRLERLPLGERGADLVRLTIAGDEQHVQMALIVGEIGFGLLAAGHSVAGFTLKELR